MQVCFGWHNFGEQLLPTPAAKGGTPSLDVLQVIDCSRWLACHMRAYTIVTLCMTCQCMQSVNNMSKDARVEWTGGI